MLLLELVEEDLGDLVDDAGVLGGDEIPVDDTRDGLAAVVDDGAARELAPPTGGPTSATGDGRASWWRTRCGRSRSTMPSPSAARRDY